MNIVGRSVSHKKFGSGKIASLEKNGDITIAFDGDEKPTRRFQFPTPFVDWKYLSTDDAELADAIKNLIDTGDISSIMADTRKAEEQAAGSAAVMPEAEPEESSPADIPDAAEPDSLPEVAAPPESEKPTEPAEPKPEEPAAEKPAEAPEPKPAKNPTKKPTKKPAPKAAKPEAKEEAAPAPEEDAASEADAGETAKKPTQKGKQPPKSSPKAAAPKKGKAQPKPATEEASPEEDSTPGEDNAVQKPAAKSKASTKKDAKGSAKPAAKAAAKPAAGKKATAAPDAEEPAAKPAKPAKDAKKAKEEAAKKPSKSDYVPPERVKGVPHTFFVFQTKTYKQGASGGYIWAPYSLTDGTTQTCWDILEHVMPGDIIIHGEDAKIKAISQVKSKSYEAKRPAEFDSKPRFSDMGRKIDCEYVPAKSQVPTKNFIEDIMRLAANRRYSPFNSNGTGNTGYLYDLDPELAQIFIKGVAEANPQIKDAAFIKKFLGMKLGSKSASKAK